MTGGAPEVAPESLGRLLLRPGGEEEWSPPRPELRRVYIFGSHHSCTNALAREIPRFFAVSVENNDCQQGSPLWKHRIFSSFGLPSLEVEEDAFCICLVKDPCFWIQSLKRDPEGGTFYDILPIREGGDDDGRSGEGGASEPAGREPDAEVACEVRFVQAGDDLYDEQADYQHWERSPAWATYPDFDLPDRADVEQMDARDLDAVKRRVESQGYAGFSVLDGRAYLKARRPWLSEEALKRCRAEDHGRVVFHLFGPQDLEVGDFVRLSGHAPTVRDAFEAGGEAWDDQLAGMLGGVFRVLELPSPTIVGLPSPDGNQGGVWYFPVGLLRPIRFEAGELVRLDREDPNVRELLDSEQHLDVRLLKTLRVQDMPEPGVVAVSAPADRERAVLCFPASALRREMEVVERDDLVWVRRGVEAVRTALRAAGAAERGEAEGGALEDVLGRVCVVLEVQEGGLLQVALQGSVDGTCWLVPAAAVRKVRETSYGPDWLPSFCCKATEASQLFAPVFFDGVRYGDAAAVWEAAVRSYFDEEVFPAAQTAVVRSEDVLFSFDQVIRALARRGLPTACALPKVCRQLEAPAKARGHPACTRSGLRELQDYYADPAKRYAGLSDDQRLRLLRVASVAALGYGPEPLEPWPRRAIEEPTFGGW